MHYRHAVQALSVAAVCALIGACVTRPTIVIDSGAPQTNLKSGAITLKRFDTQNTSMPASHSS
jgi:hypothetical protein